MSLRPVRCCSCILHQFVVGGYKRSREGRDPKVWCEVFVRAFLLSVPSCCGGLSALSTTVRMCVWNGNQSGVPPARGVPFLFFMSRERACSHRERVFMSYGDLFWHRWNWGTRLLSLCSFRPLLYGSASRPLMDLDELNNNMIKKIILLFKIHEREFICKRNSCHWLM